MRQFLLLVLFIATPSIASELDATEQAIAAFADESAEEAIDLLRETVNISSGTMNYHGVRKLGERMREEFEALGLETEWIDMSDANRSGHLFARSKLTSGGPKILLIGHLDTVFEADDAFQTFERDGQIAKGPGVSDMKSGNVIIVYALRALKELDLLDKLDVTVALTGDEEEPGEPLSVVRRDLIAAGKWADIALGFESAVHYDGQDWATVARRSSSGWMLTVDGRQAHSSGIFSERVGAGAIFEAARILDAFYDEVRGEKYLTFNAGTIQGGTDVSYDPQQNRGITYGKTNVVPRKVFVHGGIRTISNEQLERARESMQAIVAQNLPETQASIEFSDGYPSMPPTKGNARLQAMLSDINVALGRGEMPALDPARRGAADISFVAPYVDGLAGLGGLGSGSHSPNESFELDSLPLAVKRAAILMYRLSKTD